MRARDVMTTTVHTVGPDTPVTEVAQLLLKHRISGAPVVDAEGRVLGVVSEGDLMRRPESGTIARRAWWLSLVASNDELARDYVKTHGTKAGDVMSQPVITVEADADLAAVAALLEKRRIKRLPVLQDGQLVGIVTRSNSASWSDRPARWAAGRVRCRHPRADRERAQGRGLGRSWHDQRCRHGWGRPSLVDGWLRKRAPCVGCRRRTRPRSPAGRRAHCGLDSGRLGPAS